MNGWYLEDVVQTASANSESFFIPSEAERCSKAPGDLVRLHFVLVERGPDDPRAERMWVEVSEREGSGAQTKYRGVLTNQPGFLTELGPGDEIAFEPVHIAQTWLREDDPNWLAVGDLAALVSKKALEPGERIRFAYREPPDREEDSGWRFFAGDESEEYSCDPGNIRVCNVYWLAERDPSLLEILRAETGEAFALDDATETWVVVEDWSPPE